MLQEGHRQVRLIGLEPVALSFIVGFPGWRPVAATPERCRISSLEKPWIWQPWMVADAWYRAVR